MISPNVSVYRYIAALIAIAEAKLDTTCFFCPSQKLESSFFNDVMDFEEYESLNQTPRCFGRSYHSVTTPCNATPGRKPSAFNFRTKAKGLMHLGSIEMIRLDTVDSPTVKGNMCFFSCSDSWNFTILLRIVDIVFTYDGFVITYVLERASGAKIKSIRFIS